MEMYMSIFIFHCPTVGPFIYSHLNKKDCILHSLSEEKMQAETCRVPVYTHSIFLLPGHSSVKE